MTSKIVIVRGDLARAIYTSDPDATRKALEVCCAEFYEEDLGEFDRMLKLYPETAPIVASTTMQVELAWAPSIDPVKVRGTVQNLDNRAYQRLASALGVTPASVRAWWADPDGAPVWFFPAVGALFAAAVGHSYITAQP